MYVYLLSPEAFTLIPMLMYISRIAILPCTPLAIVKTLEYLGVYNSILPYGQRGYGRTITVINRSEVVGRPLAALLANDGARVFSVDVDNIQEFSRRRSTSASKASSSLPHHVVKDSKMSLEDCLKMSDTVITGVPSKGYKVKTANLRDGVVAINFSSEKNFEANIKDKVGQPIAWNRSARLFNF